MTYDRYCGMCWREYVSESPCGYRCPDCQNACKIVYVDHVSLRGRRTVRKPAVQWIGRKGYYEYSICESIAEAIQVAARRGFDVIHFGEELLKG